MSTKYEILAVLEENRGKAVSGQQLADTLGISRTAVWKAVRALEEDGHMIKAKNNRGYCLDKESDRLSAEGIGLHLPSELRGRNIYVYDTVDSTNTQAKRLLLDGAPHGTVIAAEEQTAGRGRRGKNFYSPGRTGLYMSIILHPRANGIRDIQMITVAAAVAVCRAIEGLTPKKPQIKWVNDIYIDGRKVCGILTEAIGDFESGQTESVVIGIGVNVSTKEFPDLLTDFAGALNVPGLSRCRLAAEIISGVDSVLGKLGDPSVIEDYRKRSFLLGKDISFERAGGEINASVLAINESGNLVVRDETGVVHVLNSGEVNLRRWHL